MKTSFTSIVLFIFVLVLVVLPFSGCSGQKQARNYPGQLKPGTAEFILNEGIFYLNSGNLAMAEKKLKKALKKKPTMLAAVNALGIVYLNKRDFKNAIKYFTQVVRMNPQYYDAYNYLGVLYTEMGEYNLAKENLLIAANATLYRTPENAFANLANLEIRQKKYESALRYIDKGLQKNDRFAPLCNLKGIVLENQKKYISAIRWYERAITLLTEPDVTFLINIGRVYSTMGYKDKALDTLEKALSKALTQELKVRIRKMIVELEKKK
jgi:Tfp pilus assembly protein PilF